VQQVRRAPVGDSLGQLDRLLRVVARRAGDDRHSAVRLTSDDLDHTAVLVDRHRRRLARASARHEKMDALGDLPVHERAQRVLVERRVVVERRHQCRTATRQSCSVRCH
jgi:hypothetical protein